MALPAANEGTPAENLGVEVTISVQKFGVAVTLEFQKFGVAVTIRLTNGRTM